MDANPGLFEHILDYLRRGTFPLAFDKGKGHDYALYAKLLEEAKYFQCPALITWLEDSCYEKCVSFHITRDVDDRLEIYRETSASTDISGPIPEATETDKIYVCPRGINLHRGAPYKCGRQCRNALEEGGPEYATKKNIVGWYMVTKETAFNRGWMTDSG